jgi:glycosyltransferase involved in cell wall biosynthesis
MGIGEDRIEVISNGVDLSRYYPRDRDTMAMNMTRKYGIQSPYLLYISRIEHPGKNHVRLIRAFERLKKANNLPHQLVLAGSDWGRAEEVHRVAQTSTWSQDILFTGFVDDEDLPELYCGADLFVFPSLFEGFGIPIIEAMASGIPVACSNVSSMPEVAGGAAQLFDPEDDISIEKAMSVLLLDSELSEQHSRLGLAQSARFRWETATQKITEVLKAVSVRK